MRAVVIHAARDLRVDQLASSELGSRDVLVRLAVGGICGSDLHYYLHGGFGAVRIQEPMILGHEVAGTVVSVRPGVTRVKVGDRVAINPSVPCGRCQYCLEGKRQQCLDMRFYGSAMRFPHVQGAFCDEIAIDAAQAFPIADDTPFEEAVFAEPFSVALHAVGGVGSLVGKRVLVTGTGTIGCLVILAVRHAGASEIVVTDISDSALATARKVGADRTVNVASHPEGLGVFTANKGYFDMAFECSGNGRVVAALPEVIRACGAVTLIGLGGETPLPVSLLVTKEINLRGSFRFDAEFGWATDLLARRVIDVRPLMSGAYPLERAVEAFDHAADRSRSMKVQLLFGQ